MSNDKRARSVFSERLRMLRKSNNLTQKQVAQSLSIDRSTYAYYEIDKTKPDYDTLLRISRISMLVWTFFWAATGMSPLR